MLTISLTAQKPRTDFVIPGGIVTFSPRIPVCRQRLNNDNGEKSL